MIGEEETEKPQYSPSKRNVLAIVSVICGLGGFLILPVFLGPIAIFSGAVAYSQIKNNPSQKGKELAIAGILLGIIDIITLAVFVHITL